MSLADSAGEVARLFERAESLWRNYVEGARTAIREWERLRPLLYERISVLKAMIRVNLEEMRELSLKVELGLVSEAKAKRRLEVLGAETPALVKELGELWILLEELTEMTILHSRRMGVPAEVREEDIEAKARELEECFHGSVIDKEAYEKLRGVIARQLAALKSLPPHG